MNIMKTNMLLLDNKIMKEDAGNTTVEAPVPSTVQPKSGMKALMFQGMQNLMANPRLAKGVGVMNDDAEAEKNESAKSYVAPYSSNIAFQGNVKTAAVASLAALAAATLASCDETKVYGEPVNVVQNVEVKVDFTAVTALLANMQAMLAQFMSQSANGNEALLAQLQEMSDKISALSKQQANDNAAIMALLSNLGDQIFVMNADMNNKFDENNAYQKVIIGLLEQHMTRGEAIELFNKLYAQIEDHSITVAQAMAMIMDKLDLVNQNLENINKTIKDAAAQASKERAALYEVAIQIRNNGYATVKQQQIMIAQNKALIQQNKVIINNQEIIANKIDSAAISVNASIQECAEYLGMKVDDLAEIVARTGKSLEEVMKMSKSEIVSAIKTNTAEIKNTNNKLDTVNTNINKVDLSIQDNTGAIVQAASDIVDVLNQISNKIDALGAYFAESVSMFRNKLNDLAAIANGIYVNGQINNAMVADLGQQVFSLRGDVRNIKITAQQIKENLENGVAVDMEQLEEFFKILNMHQNASKEEIIAKLDEFIASQDKIENAINKLGDENNSKLDYISVLIKNKTNDNADVIEAINNFANANEENIAAATEALASKIDALIARADTSLNKMDNIAANLYQYGNEILDKMGTNEEILNAIRANGAKLDVQNMTIEQMKAELEKLKPELQTLNNSAATANTYLDLISKRQLEIKQQIADLEAIAGKSLTKDELEALWQQHDAAGFAKAKAYLDGLHADDMDKADEIIEYLKQGNQTAADTYNLLLNAANKANLSAEQLRDLLKAINDYLPNLVCKCNCSSDCNNNNTVHEGIIGIID